MFHLPENDIKRSIYLPQDYHTQPYSHNSFYYKYTSVVDPDLRQLRHPPNPNRYSTARRGRSADRTWMFGKLKRLFVMLCLKHTKSKRRWHFHRRLQHFLYTVWGSKIKKSINTIQHTFSVCHAYSPECSQDYSIPIPLLDNWVVASNSSVCAKTPRGGELLSSMAYRRMLVKWTG